MGKVFEGLWERYDKLEKTAPSQIIGLSLFLRHETCPHHLFHDIYDLLQTQ